MHNRFYRKVHMAKSAEQRCVDSINLLENAAFKIYPFLKKSIIWSICKNEDSFYTTLNDKSGAIDLHSLNKPWENIKEVVPNVNELLDYYKLDSAFGRANTSLFNPHRHLVPSTSYHTLTIFRENTNESVSNFYEVDSTYQDYEYELRKDEKKKIIDTITFYENDIYSINGIIWHDWITKFSTNLNIFTTVSICVLKEAKTIEQRDKIIDYLENLYD